MIYGLVLFFYLHYVFKQRGNNHMDERTQLRMMLAALPYARPTHMAETVAAMTYMSQPASIGDDPYAKTRKRPRNSTAEATQSCREQNKQVRYKQLGGRCGRNEKCVCGSGRKHKACCGRYVLPSKYIGTNMQKLRSIFGSCDDVTYYPPLRYMLLRGFPLRMIYTYQLCGYASLTNVTGEISPANLTILHALLDVFIASTPDIQLQLIKQLIVEKPQATA